MTINLQHICMCFLMIIEGLPVSLSYEGITVGSPCKLHANCNNALHEKRLLNSICLHSKCACASGYHGDFGSQVCQKVNLGSKCNSTSLDGSKFCGDGVPNSVCNHEGGSCVCAPGTARTITPWGHEYCQCPGGKYYDASTLQCVEKDNVTNNVNSAYKEKRICDSKLSCKCKTGYKPYAMSNSNLPIACAMVINSTIDPNCFWCDNNNGACVDTSGDYLRDGCLCPETRRTSFLHHPSYDCDTSLFETNCHKDSMITCYFPPEKNVLHRISGRKHQNEEYKVAVETPVKTKECTFAKKSQGTYCAQLSLRPSMMDVCGIEQVNEGEGVELYTAKVSVQSSDFGDKNVLDRFTFISHCRYDHPTGTTFGWTDIVSFSMQKSEENDELHPRLLLSVKNRDGDVVSKIYETSQVQLVVELLDFKNVYTSIMVDLCEMANSANLDDTNIRTVPLIINGCASTNGSEFTHQPLDKRIIRTSLFTLPNIDGADKVYIHCIVRVCRQNGGCVGNDCSKRRRSEMKKIPRNWANNGSFHWGVLAGANSAGIRVLQPLKNTTPKLPAAKAVPFDQKANVAPQPANHDDHQDNADLENNANGPNSVGAVVDSQDTAIDSEKACEGLFGSCHFLVTHLVIAAVGSVVVFILFTLVAYYIYTRRSNRLREEILDSTCELSSAVQSIANSRNSYQSYWTDNTSYI